MRTYIQKWGNSLALRLPLHLSKKFKLNAGIAVDIESEEDHIVIRKAKYDLAEMLGKITPENCHSAMEDDNSIGGEEW